MSVMTVGLSSALIGMVIVLSVLALISILISFFKPLFGEKEKKVEVPQETTVAVVPQSSTEIHMDEESEVVAAIMAAIYELSRLEGVSSDRLVVRSIRKIEGWR